ncbi:hypothetical protein RBY4I_3588 [Rhodobacterales bacterium Y4I]|nr:hypothetical protein RBY4I_3588 [Rhodobacterales bacterium Y4I]
MRVTRGPGSVRLISGDLRGKPLNLPQPWKLLIKNKKGNPLVPFFVFASPRRTGRLSYCVGRYERAGHRSTCNFKKMQCSPDLAEIGGDGGGMQVGVPVLQAAVPKKGGRAQGTASLTGRKCPPRQPQVQGRARLTIARKS